MLTEMIQVQKVNLYTIPFTYRTANKLRVMQWLPEMEQRGAWGAKSQFMLDRWDGVCCYVAQQEGYSSK